MYSVKGSWAGQAFALAATNDSGAKKSRIRRSKEERKTMVELFIKRYQSSNNGNFPSLNLTHKEVGGSFYTVREIVREIIQENRVLGPGQISSEEQREDTFALDYPLGTMSSEPQGVLFTTESEMNDFTNLEREETVVLNFDNSVQYTKHFDVGDVQYSIEHRTDGIGEAGDSELVFKPTGETVGIYNHQEQASFGTSLNRDGQCFSVNETDSVNVLDHTQTMMLEESDKQLAEVTPGYETSADGESGDMGVIQATLVLPTEEVEVETFPLRPAIIETDDFGSILTDSKNFDRNFDDLEDKEAKFSNSTLLSDKVGFFDTSSELVTTKEADDSEVSVSESHDMMAQHPEVNYMVEVNLKNDSVDMSSSLPMKKDTATIPECMNQALQLGDSTSKAAEQNNYQLQSKNGSKGTSYVENNNGTSSKNAKEVTVVNGNDFKRDEKATVGNSPPLDRINLESWTASKQETNPLVAFFKAFVGAFVKFWSE